MRSKNSDLPDFRKDGSLTDRPHSTFGYIQLSQLLGLVVSSLLLTFPDIIVLIK